MVEFGEYYIHKYKNVGVMKWFNLKYSANKLYAKLTDLHETH